MSDERVDGLSVEPVEAANRGSGGRGAWNSRLGFVLAAVGSAVGLGNMWRFPYLTAENGGAAFVFLYIGMTLLIGIPVMLAEFTLGRGTGQSSITAFRASGGRRWVPFGYLFVLTGVTILAFYSVIAGWTSRYALSMLFSGLPADAGAYFDTVSTGGGAMGYHLGFMVLVIAIVMGGVEKGIERASYLMMPALFIVLGGLAVWATTLKGSGEGYAFYLTPEMSELLEPSTIAAAAGQAFFSLSLGMGAMLTFSSYLSKDSNLPREGGTIAFTDFGVALVAGLVIFPVIFALGLSEAVGESTLGTLFIALPEAFAEIGGLSGRAVGTLFFIALFIGAITSAISLLEVITSAMIDEWGIPRKSAAIGGGIVVALFGLWPAANLDALGAMDAVTGNIFLPVGALGLALYIGWVLKDPIAEVAQGTSQRMQPWLKGWLWLLRVLVPITLVIVLAMGFDEVKGAIQGLFGG